MVRWFSPALFLKTLFMVLVARAFGRYADPRQSQASRPVDGPYRYDNEDEIRLDYVADLGDGWNSTATVAHLLAADHLMLDGQKLPHGRVLLMGGDEVYPAASRDEYLHRLEAPYYGVLPHSPEDAPRDLFVLPGNHDWYDGLAAFSRLFMQQRWFAGWRTQQTRSYFVLKLPQRWWLIAADIQLDNDIDAAQRDYLVAATAQIAPGDAVILLTAEPFWLAPADSILRRNIAWLERKLVQERGASVRLCLTGDLHHYQRHAGDDGAQRIISGGGGAFLHGTAWQSRQHVETQPAGSTEKVWHVHSLFPSPATSRASLWRLLLFPFLNAEFALALGVLLVFLLWGIDSASHGLLFANIRHGASAGPYALLEALPWSPWIFLAAIGWFSAFVAFVEPPGQWPVQLQRLVHVPLGMLHGFLHLLAGFWLLSFVMPSRLDDAVEFFGFLGLLALLQALLSGLIFGAYLYVSYQLAGFHRETVFAAARIADWKNFLRLHIAVDGSLTVHVIGIPRVCRRWREREAQSADDPLVEPADGLRAEDRAFVVEKIVIDRQPATG